MGHQTDTPLTATDFSGGEAGVVRKLQTLGFRVVRLEISEESSRLPEEVPATFPEGIRSSVTVDRAERSSAARLASTCMVSHVESAEWSLETSTVLSS